MSACDLCNKEIPLFGKYYSADQMRAAVQKGLRPPMQQSVNFGGVDIGVNMRDMMAMMTGKNITDDTAIEGWREQVMADTTGWTLCDSCAKSVDGYL